MDRLEAGSAVLVEQDAVPLILLVGQVERRDLRRNAFQEIDYRRMFGQMAKWVAQIDRTVPAPEHLGNDVIEIREGEPIELDLRIESVMEGVLISGSVTATATGACVRCLEPVHEPVDVEFQELFAYADRAAHHHEVAAAQHELGLTFGTLTSR